MGKCICKKECYILNVTLHTQSVTVTYDQTHCVSEVVVSRKILLDGDVSSLFIHHEVLLSQVISYQLVGHLVMWLLK